MKKKTLFIVIITILLSLVVYNYIYQEHRDITKEEPEFVMNSDNLFKEFSIDPSTSESKYLNKIIEISGLITRIDSNSILIDNSIFCQLLPQLNTNLSSNIKIFLKGRFIGYDDLLNQVKLDQCIIINKH